jgi:N-acetyl-S-(2-succino)cysteine monooxygenase
MTRSLHINVFVPTTGHHEASWLYPKTQPERVSDIDYYQEIAAIAERGKLDSLFLGDHPAIGRNIRHVAQGRLEPFTMLSALAVNTQRIGLIASASTTYTEPYNLARQLASLDHVSKGRAGWNIVTSWQISTAQNFGNETLISHADRYARAAEHVEVARKLWDSWEDDARVFDRSAGIFADTNKIHEINHVGKLFKVRGPLDVPRSPQGHPLLVQAGSSEEGRSFAARYAEAIFTAQQDFGDASRFYADVKSQAKALGRDPDAVSILPGLSPIVASTDTEAHAIEDELNDLILPQVGLKHLSQRFDGYDFTKLPLDRALKIDDFPDASGVQGAQSRAYVILEIVKRERPTMRQLLQRLAGGRGHKVLAGSPKNIADHMIEWFDGRASDGFNLMPAYLPGNLVEFVDQVVPELQRRGYFRKDYTGSTLREHYGLIRPESRYATR